jgi:hypothetical protein
VRVLVCGGRKFADPDRVWLVLNELHASPHVSVVIHGGASGADAHAARWAWLCGVPALPFDADWDKHGKAAGPRRNQRMLDEGKPDLVLAFPGGKGTADMVRRAKRAGVPVREVKP